MKRILRIALPLIVLGLSAATGLALIATGPEAERRLPSPMVPTVEVLEIQPRDYPVVVHSRGTVSPRTQSTLIPEVAGRIVEVAPSFRNGGFFEAGDVLVRIDPRNYQHALTMARAELAQARLALNEEQAQGEQANRDWEKLGMKGQPSELALRRPQLESARAAVAAATAQLHQAEADLERTFIRAPYAGRVLEKQVDVGQYVAPGNPLATVYAVDYVEVRLPLTDRQVALVDLPETYRGEAPAGPGPEVTLSAITGGQVYHWEGRIVRTEGAIDIRSRQLFVVAQVDDPYARRADNRPPLKVGQFVEATIAGRTLSGVFVLPREAVREENEVLVVTPEGRIERRQLEVIWRDQNNLVAGGGLAAGERLSLTPLSFAVDGAPVRVQASRRAASTAGGS
ncbi:MAG: efflux RND transporter periplasmic adaptor subunit [Chromatiaceae bacterium]|nr:efflux RND transporter periplasmic adaptor subunit [Chromatiaceae bacterium]